MKRRLVRGRGPVPCDIALIGEAPGKTEHYQRRPFVGKSGAILNVNLFHARIVRDNIWVGNAFPYWLGRDKAGNDITPTEEQILEEASTLTEQLEKVRPKIIGTVGRASTRLFLGDVNMESVHGIPHWCPSEIWAVRLGLTGDPAVILPIVHPAAGFRKEIEGVKSFWDTKQLGLLVRGEIEPVSTEAPQYETAYEPGGLRTYASRLREPRVAMDTEGSLDDPICLSYTTDGDTGVVVSRSLGTLHLEPGTTVTMQYAVHDIPILRKMGVNIDQCKIVDTLVLAYILGVEPRGLKELSRRHLHFDMLDYKEVVGGYYDAACLKWVLRASETDWGKPEERLRLDPKTRRLKPYRPQSVNTRIKGMITTYKKTGEVEWENRWSSIPQDLRAPVEEVQGRFPRFSSALRLVPKREMVDYAGLDAVATWRIEDILWSRVDALGLRPVAEQDMAIVPMIERMERVGIKVDTDRFKELAPKYEAAMAQIQREVSRTYLHNKPINLGSSQQVSDLLYNTLDLEVSYRTRRGKPSVGKKALESLRAEHPVIDLIRRYKMIAKNLSFAEGLPGFVDNDGRIRGTIKYWVVVSGRLSMENPNMQQIPVRTEEGKEIRNAFTAGDDSLLLLSSDYDQLEMKVMAHFSKDKRLVGFIVKGVDIHIQTAALLFGVEPDRVTKLQRTVTKNINYGIIYQIQEQGLYDALKIAGVEGYSIDDCARVIKEWYRLYPGVGDLVEEIKAQCRREGGIRTRWGRMRWLPAIYSPIEYMSAEAGRKAVSHLISGTAADIIKRAMARLDPFLAELRRDYYAEAVLQIHDEMLLELHRKHKWAAKAVRKLMTADSKLFRVPITAGANVGFRWGELK